MSKSVPLTSLILLGAGGHAKSCINLIESVEKFNIQGILGKKEEVGHEILGYKVLGTDNDLADLSSESSKAIVTLGQIKSPLARINLYKLISSLDLTSSPIISPFASISNHTKVGKGTVVMHGSLLNADTKIGNNCILNSQCVIEHEVIVGDHCHISTGVRLNGNVTIEDECFIGSGVTIREGVTIGKGSIIAMGENIFYDCPPGVTINSLKN